jgi:hypothetical protein
MFKIRLNFQSFYFTGLKALEIRRAYNMSDGVKISMNSTYIEQEVDENFAKAHFKEQEIIAEEPVSLKLIPYDCLKSISVEHCALQIELIEYRMQQIFINARRNKVEAWKKLVKKYNSCSL